MARQNANAATFWAGEELTHMKEKRDELFRECAEEAVANLAFKIAAERNAEDLARAAGDHAFKLWFV